MHGHFSWTKSVSCEARGEAHSFRQATLSENCSLIRTDNISVNIFAQNEGYCLHIPELIVYIVLLTVCGVL